ncbi:MAG: M24 family metallopeptidase [Neomegalonema sp.]|nr:M24 family metallopeptidase [Neomegalonema sp.]
MPNPPLKRVPLFTAEEYGQRLASLRQAMQLHEVELLILSDPANISWLTGWDGVGQGLQQVAILDMRDPPRWWGAESDQPAAAASVWMQDDRVSAYSETGRTQHPFVDLAAKLAEWGHGGARIGVELDSANFTAACIGQLISDLPGARFKDATGLADLRRLVKSEAEIALLRRAAARADAALEQAFAMIVPDMRPSAILAEATKALLCDDAEQPAFGGVAAIAPTVLAGAAGGAPGLGWTDEPFDAGQAITLSLAGAVRRYHCPVSRAVSLGEPDDETVQAAARAAEALEAAIAAAKPGAPVGAVADAFYGALGGTAAKSAIGFSTGLAFPPRMRERGLRVEPGEGAELIPGMCLHLCAGPAQLGASIQIADTILVGEAGAESLITTPRDLAVKL